jgi:uncharacterized protein
MLDRIAYVRPNRLRAGWRIALFLLAGIAASNLGLPLVASVLPNAAMQWLRPSFECGAVLFATWWVTHTVDKTGWEAVGLGAAAWQPRRLALGASTGALAIAIPTAALIGVGYLTFVDEPTRQIARPLLMSVAVLAPAALTEELLLRGYPFAVLAETWRWPVATAVTSVLFGLAHLRNPGVNALAIANVMAAGVFLAGVRLVTGSLAAAWAAHFAWNWTMLAGFHTAVSGLPFETPMYHLIDSGPDWLSGGVWGPEGGVAAAVGMIGAFAGLSWATRKTRRAAAGSVARASETLHSGGATRHQEHQV